MCLRLVLLPGMDGTGLLFDEFLSFYDGKSVVIPLPTDTLQDYESLAQDVEEKMPREDIVLLAESFSGGIVPHLLNITDKPIKCVIFVAGFLTPPNRLLLALARMLPIKNMATMPISMLFHRFLFLGKYAPRSQIDRFVEVVRSVPDAVLNKRLEIMMNMQMPRMTTSIPSAYIQATEDKLVNAGKWSDFLQIFRGIKHYQIKGPHFILQSKPLDSAKLISEVAATLPS